MYECVTQRLYEHVLARPDAPCLIDDQHRLSFEESWRCALGFGRWLTSRGLRRGDRVAALTNQSVPHAVAQLGVELAGGAFVPLDASLPRESALAICADVGARFVVAAKGDGLSERFVPVSEALAHRHDGPMSEEPDWPRRDELAYILFTTGTTGRSKGVLKSHGSTVHYIDAEARFTGPAPGDVELIPAPLNHMLGLFRMLAVLSGGGAALLWSGVAFVDPLFRAMRAHRATGMTLVPSMAKLLMRLGGAELGAFDGQIDHVIIASAALPEVDREQLMSLLPRARMINMYGSTEGGLATYIDYKDTTAPSNCVGRACAGTAVRTLDEGGLPMDATSENPGRIAWRSPSRMDGYWSDPELTRETLVDGFVRTSDLGYIGADGLLYLVGRVGDVIQMGGHKIAPSEVEDAALRAPGVSDCACVPMADAAAGQVPRLVVVMRPGAAFDEGAIARHLERRLPRHMLPRRIDAVAQLPRTGNGKLLRRVLIESMKGGTAPWMS